MAQEWTTYVTMHQPRSQRYLRFLRRHRKTNSEGSAEIEVDDARNCFESNRFIILGTQICKNQINL